MQKLNEMTEKEIEVKTQLLMEILGVNIKKQRIKQKMSRTELAFYAKTTESRICDIENGKKAGISVYSIVKLSEALEISIDSLFCK